MENFCVDEILAESIWDEKYGDGYMDEFPEEDIFEKNSDRPKFFREIERKMYKLYHSFFYMYYVTKRDLKNRSNIPGFTKLLHSTLNKYTGKKLGEITFCKDCDVEDIFAFATAFNYTVTTAKKIQLALAKKYKISDHIEQMIQFTQKPLLDPGALNVVEQAIDDHVFNRPCAWKQEEKKFDTNFLRSIRLPF